MNKVKVGLAGFFHKNARNDDQAFTRIKNELIELSIKNDFELYIYSEKIYEYKDGLKAYQILKGEDLDFIFLLSVSVLLGDALIPFGRLNTKIGIWSLPEGPTNRFLPMNSICGSMIFAGMFGKFHKDYGKKFKWFYGYTDNPLFIDRFNLTLKVLKAEKILSDTTIGCIGPLVKGFDYLTVDESRIEKLFGVHLDRFHTIEEAIELAKNMPETLVREKIKQFNNAGTISEQVSTESLEKNARFCLAIEKIARDNDFRAIALSCWSKLQEEYGIVACSTVSMLNDAGLIVACEGDVDGAIGMLVEKSFSNQVSTMVDLVAIDQSDESINVWHCGPAAKCLANNEGLRWEEHFNMGKYDNNGNWNGCGMVANLVFKEGQITLSRIDSRSKKIFVFSGDVILKKSFQGSSGWVKNLRNYNSDIKLNDLLQTIYKEYIDHHLTLGYGDTEKYYIELAHWHGLEFAEFSKYKDFY